MEPMDFDSFVTMINEMASDTAKKAESPISKLSSEELALIKAFDPELLDEISAGKLTPSEAILLARSATSNQEQEHAVKEDASECASSALSGIFEAAEQRLENNREEAKKLKEEADTDLEDEYDEGISDEEWQEGLDDKYEEISDDKKLSPNIADQVDLSNPKMHFKSAQDADVQYVIDNDIPCAFWDYDENYVEAGLLYAVDGMGNFIKDDETVWVNCAILDNVKKSSFTPECPLDDVEDYKNVDESEDEIIVEEEMYFIPELKGKIGKIWQGEPTTDFNEAYDQAMTESYMYEDCEVVVRDSLNRNVLDEGIGSALMKGAKWAAKGAKWLGKTLKGGADDAAKTMKLDKNLEKLNKAVKFGDDAAEAAAKGAKTSKAAKAAKGAETAAKAAKGSKLGQAAKTTAKATATGAAGAGIWDTAKDWIKDKLDKGINAYTNTINSLADHGAGLSGTKATSSVSNGVNNKPY